MAYSAEADVDRIFGSTNVDDWLDLDRDGSADTGQLTWAIAKADRLIDSRMKRSRYRVPVVDASGSTPSEITDISAALAGGYAYENQQGENEDDEVKAVVDKHKEMLEAIVFGRFPISAM